MFEFGPVVIDHEMPMDEEPMGELDILDGLRAMSMFKRDPGPLKPTDLNQEVKYALAENPHCLDMLYQEGFLDESLVREMEQMIEESVSAAASMPQMTQPGVIVMTQGVYGGESGGPKKKSKSRVNEAGNYTKPGMRKRQYQRIKAGGKGGKPGQWSARKAQMLASAYKKAGGGYRD
jgi:hypothetical protein